MASTLTRVLLAAATFLTGILAGGAVDRVIVGGPATLSSNSAIRLVPMTACPGL
jgi:hypothetical protein